MRSKRLLAWALVAALGAGCASTRYIGTVGDTGVYVNLGYGVTLGLHAHELAARWKLVDVGALDGIAAADRPQELNEPLDLDGDGALAPLETTRFLRPTVRLLARSSSAAGARIDVDVAILGGPEAQRPLDDVARLALRELVGPTVTATAWTASERAPRFATRITEGAAGGGRYKLAVIDQQQFQGEASAHPRRQSVRVLMIAPALTPELTADFDHVLDALSLASQGGPVAPRDRW